MSFCTPITARFPAVIGALACAFSLQVSAQPAASPPAADGEFSAGLSIRPSTTPEGLGLPLYPGAVPHKEADDKHAGASIGAWGGPFGLQINALKLRSRDAPADVASWYRDALQRQGKVLECGTAAAAEAPAAAEAADKAEKAEDKKTLRCGSDRAKPGGALYKLGTPAHVRVVAIEPLGEGTRISLVQVQVRGVD